MAIHKLIWFLIIVLCESKQSLVPQAILKLVQNHYSVKRVIIEVFYNSHQIKILEETIKLVSGDREIKATKVYVNEEENVTIFLNDAIFLFDTIENYSNFQFKLRKSQSEQRRELNHLIYCENLTRSKVQKLIKERPFQSFIIAESEKSEKIYLYTMTMYTEKQCNEPQLIETNRFSVKERKWKTDKFFGLIIDNLHGCIVKIQFDNSLPFSHSKLMENGDLTTPEGIFVEMVKALSTHLNFTIEISFDGDLELYFEAFVVENNVHERIFLSDPLYSDSVVLVVTPGKPYTPWEKLYLPFDDETWMWLGIVFAVAFLAIFLINISRSSSLYDFVVGSNVTSPSLNVIGIFMGIGQILLPQRNVSRFFFMSFVLFCLIMRTAYQGKYFEFITTNMRKKAIATIDELPENGITVFVESDSNYYLFENWFNDNFKG